VVCGIAAFLIWGISPAYWKQLAAVSPFEILMHRMVWSFLFLLPLIAIQRQGAELVRVVKTPKIMAILLLTTLIISGNWFVFIWAVNHDQVLQTSLGYYINPLVNVFLGMVILKERLRPLQIAALLIAATGVGYLTIRFGRIPWISLTLAFSFGFYGLIKKTVGANALVGLSIETALMVGPASAYLFYLGSQGNGSFFQIAPRIDLFLMGSALVTALPLLLFTAGARRIHFSTVGFLQYIAPTCSFLLAVFRYGEPLGPGQLFTFGMIWTALALYSADSLRHYRLGRRPGERWPARIPVRSHPCDGPRPRNIRP
jgi:chloramphenicol-sensitive protein RarD